MTVYRRPDPIPLRHPATSMSDARSVIGRVRSEPDDLNRLVAREIFQAIVSGRFTAGTILPNEHQLASDLGVSRTALREAIKGLVAKGMLETRRKRGTQVLDQSDWNMLDPDIITWSRRAGHRQVSEELWFTLLATLPELAGEVAARRSAAKLEVAASDFADAQTLAVRREAFTALALDIACASGNRFLQSVVASCLRSLSAEDAAFLDQKLAAIAGSAFVGLIAVMRADGKAAASRYMANLLSEPATVTA